MASSLSSVTSGFFPSNNHDRLYTSDQLANLFSALITDGAVQGSSENPDTVPFKVSLSANDPTVVTIGKGLAWLKNTWTRNSGVASLSMSDAIAIDVSTGTRRTGGSTANNSNPRWDAISIEVNKSLNIRANSFVVVEGIPAISPSRPDVSVCNNETEGRYYYALAFVYRYAGSGYSLGQASNNLILAIGQNGGIPYVTSLVNEPTSIDDLLSRWDDDIETKLAELDQRIAEAGSAVVPNNTITSAKLVASSVTTPKIADGAVTPDKLGFKVPELTPSNKIPADNASSEIVDVNASMTMSTYHAGKTIRTTANSPCTITLPSTENWRSGCEMEIVRWGSGPVSIVGSGNTRFFSSSTGERSSVAIATRYGTVVLKMMTLGNWLVAGDVG